MAWDHNNEPSWRRMIASLTRTWLATTGALLLLIAPLAEGQTATADKVARVGLLLYTSSLDQAPKLAAAFREGLRERGWVEGGTLSSRNAGRRVRRSDWRSSLQSWSASRST